MVPKFEIEGVDIEHLQLIFTQPSSHDHYTPHEHRPSTIWQYTRMLSLQRNCRFRFEPL